MKKKFLFSVFFLFLFSVVTNAFAQIYKGQMAPCPPPKRLKDELYVGVGAGYDAYRIRQSFDILDSAAVTRSGNPVLSANGFQGSIFAGYGRYFGWFYIAGELLANYTEAQTHFSTGPYNTNISLRTSYGASLLPGIRLGDQSLLYGRLGYIRTYLKSVEGGTTAGNATDSNWENGADLGVGVETLLIGNLSLRAEYNHIFYNAFTTPLSTRISPSNNQFVLGLVYHFDPFE